MGMDVLREVLLDVILVECNLFGGLKGPGEFLLWEETTELVGEFWGDHAQVFIWWISGGRGTSAHMLNVSPVSVIVPPPNW